jgi:hypothetical protein
MGNPKQSAFFLHIPYNVRLFVPVLTVMIALLVTENVDSYVADFLVEFNTSNSGITLFGLISASYVVGTLFILKFIDRNIQIIRSRSRLIYYIHMAVSMIWYVLAANIIVITFQILVFSKYFMLSLILATSLSNLFTTFLLLIFGVQFLSWFRAKQHSLSILLYGLAFLILSFSEIMAGVSDSYLILSQRDQLVNPASDVKLYDFPEGSFFNQFYNYYDYIDYSSFFLILLATAPLLYHYGRRTDVNKLKLAVVMSLPLISYRVDKWDMSLSRFAID